MDALEARAWMEAQREISQNKNLIFRPDSVLSYTCFDRFVDALMQPGPDSQPFSQNPSPWGGVAHRSANSTSKYLNDIVVTTMKHYLIANRFILPLNERYPGKLKYNPWTSQTSGAAYTCDNMARVWGKVRETNFIDKVIIDNKEVETDGFYDFSYYANNDPRKFPNIPGYKVNPQTDEWEKNMSIAYNQDQDKFLLSEENKNDVAPYKEDMITTHLDKILPPGVAPANGCAAPIPTGIDIDRNGDGKPEYSEMVCPNPGCVFRIESNKCETP